MNKLVPLYEHEPGKLEKLSDRLSAVHAELTADELGGPVEHTAHLGHWAVTLESSPTGALIAASYTRCNVESYEFERAEDANWSIRDTLRQFPETHFYNLVTMATREGLEWTAAVPAAA